jgi:aldose 1-epimerase
VNGVWLSHTDCLPKEHTTAFPPSWDMNTSIPALASHVDNCFTGWDGVAQISWPDRQLQLKLLQTSSTAEVSTYSAESNHLLMYRPVAGTYFCLEPVSHPIDAFHLPDQPGLQTLDKGESLTLEVSWRFNTTPK